MHLTMFQLPPFLGVGYFLPASEPNDPDQDRWDDDGGQGGDDD